MNGLAIADFNPIEYVWDTIGTQVPSPQNAKQFTVNTNRKIHKPEAEI